MVALWLLSRCSDKFSHKLGLKSLIWLENPFDWKNEERVACVMHVPQPFWKRWALLSPVWNDSCGVYCGYKLEAWGVLSILQEITSEACISYPWGIRSDWNLWTACWVRHCSHQKVTALTKQSRSQASLLSWNSVTPRFFLNKKVTKVVYCFPVPACLVFLGERVASSEVARGWSVLLWKEQVFNCQLLHSFFFS